MPVKPSAPNATPSAQPPSPGSVSAEELTGYLKAALQTVRIAYIFVGRLLGQIRDNKIYAELGYADLESYARGRRDPGRHST